MLGRQTILRQLSIGKIAHQLGKADELPCFIADGAENAAGKETRTVLADMPAFIGGTSKPGGGFHLCLRHAAVPIFGEDEPFGALAEDFIFGISEAPLRSVVPG